MAFSDIVEWPAKFAPFLKNNNLEMNLGPAERTHQGDYKINWQGKTLEWKQVCLFAKIQKGKDRKQPT